jgi:hypothetical protein
MTDMEIEDSVLNHIRLRLRRKMPVFLYLTFAALLSCCECLSAQSIAIRSNELPWAIKGAPYLGDLITTVNGRCPLGDVGLTVITGQLPIGLELFSFGIQGTPQQMGHYRFTLRAANTCASVTKGFDLFVNAKPILMVFPRQITLQYHAGSADWPEDIIRVESTWPDLPYSIDISQASWLQVEPAEGRTPDSESALTGDRVHVHVNPSALAAGVYHTVLKFYAQAGENAPLVDVTLQVIAAN